MKTTLVLTISTLLVLLAFSAFFSASETAFSSITKIQLRQIKKSRLKKDRLLGKILADPVRMLTSLLIGNNIVNIWASSIATAVAISIFGDEGVGIATAVMTVTIIIFSEITPKTLAANDPGNLAYAFAPAILITERLLFPVYVVFSSINTFFITILKKLFPHDEHRLTEDELKTMITVGKNEGALEAGEHDLLNRAFNFTDLRLREIMTPRTAIAAIPMDASLNDIHGQFRIHRFSRMPVYDGTIDSIRGMIHYKDILFLMETGEAGTLGDLVRPVLFVPETQGTFELLREMETNNQNMAVIIDEHGGTAGLVTIDDAVAAVFGGIQDEYDADGSEPLDEVEILNDHTIRIPGDLKLADLNALLKTSLESEYFETVGGFLMELAGKLPAKGERICHENLVFLIEEQTSRKIQRIEVLLEAVTYT